MQYFRKKKLVVKTGSFYSKNTTRKHMDKGSIIKLFRRRPSLFLRTVLEASLWEWSIRYNFNLQAKK